MPRLVRILVTGATALSLALCAATLLLWARSRTTTDVLSVTAPGRWVSVAGRHDGLLFASNPSAATTWSADRLAVARSPDDVSGVAPDWRLLGLAGGSYRDPRGPSGWTLVPYAHVTALLALLPALHLVRHARARPRAPHLCPTCGYDCRATPDRCPECGTLAPR